MNNEGKTHFADDDTLRYIQSLEQQLAEAQTKLAAAERDAVGLLKAEYYRGYSDREQEVRDGIGAYGHPIEENIKENERLERENEELRAKYEKLSKLNLAQHEMYEKDNNTLHDEIAALKAQSTEPVAWLFQHEETGRTTCVETQQVEWGFEQNNPRLQKICPLYTTPPTATALLESLGDWVHERMQQADADYHDHGDDTAEAYATLKMVLSKIESMMIESLPLIEGEKESCGL